MKSWPKSYTIWLQIFSAIVTIIGAFVTIGQNFMDVGFLQKIYDFLTPQMQETIISIVFGILGILSGTTIAVRVLRTNEPIKTKQNEKKYVGKFGDGTA
jgi:hypothetical protein